MAAPRQPARQQQKLALAPTQLPAAVKVQNAHHIFHRSLRSRAEPRP